MTSLFKVNPACAAQSLVVPDLINGQEYLFRIRAENRFGFGPFTETLEGTRARDPIRAFSFLLYLFNCCLELFFMILTKGCSSNIHTYALQCFLLLKVSVKLNKVHYFGTLGI